MGRNSVSELLLRHTLARLVCVELRKLLDTRGSRWVYITLGAVSLTLAAAYTLGPRSSTVLTASLLVQSMQAPLGLAMAVLGVIGMAGDWTHRVTVNHLPLVQDRTVVYTAKILATLLLNIALLVVILLLTLCIVGLARASGRQGVSLEGLSSALGQAGVITLLATTFGLAVASVVRRVTVALVLLPVLVVGVNGAVLTFLPAVLQPAFSTLTPLLLLGDSGGLEIAGWQILTSLLLWYVGPLLIGWKIMKDADL